MEIHLNTANLLVFIAAIVLLFLLMSLFKKIIRTALILILAASLAFYVFVYSDILRNPNKHPKYSIEYLKDKYCSQMTTHKDSVCCQDIIMPIYYDLKQNYSDEELKKLEKDPVKYLKILNQSLKNNKKQIIQKLARDKEQQIWTEFINDLKKNVSNREIIDAK